jgi:hypothetical protein
MTRGRRRNQEVSDRGESSGNIGAAGTDPEHNMKARTQIINECARQMNTIKEKRSALNEEASEIRKRLKDAGIGLEAFDFAQKVEARSDDDRQAFLDDIREQFRARGLGFQSDMGFPEAAASDSAPDYMGDPAGTA